eukprot:COSAG04_NODE_13306_length_612_cov_0.779727_3_plen_65_part_01
MGADGALPRASQPNAHAPDATAWTVWRADLEDAEDEDEDEDEDKDKEQGQEQGRGQGQGQGQDKD